MSSDLSTADVCDEHADAVMACTIPLRSFGARRAFHGRAQTLSCRGDNQLLRETVSEPGEGRVLVVDGGGLLSPALVGDQVAALAIANGWSGVVINGPVRDTARLAEMQLGIAAVGTCPVRPARTGAGTLGEPVAFGGLTVTPGDLVVADGDGVVVLPAALAP
jgi:regulator of ribonuclease activity A